MKYIPDYPHDIAAAWGLAERIPAPFSIERGYETVWGQGPNGWWAEFGECRWILARGGRESKEEDGDRTYRVEVWSESAPRAITMAFVLAMTQESDGMGKGDGAGV
jgi:hypothetical protein